MSDDDVKTPVTEPPRPAEDAVPHLWPAELDADYTLLGELGRGGMAVVFRARDRELGREVAVKVVRPRFAADEEAVARLAREARTVAQLEHSNIVGVYSIRHLADRSVALVMQLIPGRTLKQAIVEDGPFSGAAAEQVLRDIARALAYAHRAGVVHRDVKPENIFLDASSGRAMLSDFGVARVMDAPTELTATGTTIGTPTYMAPEQIDGVNLDGRSDLYSLGMVGWEMLTGERPWVGESLYSVIYRQKHDQLPPIDSFREDVPARTQYLIEGLMPKNPDRRWASAARFLTLLASDQALPGFKEWESAQRRRRRSRVFQQARQRGDSVIEAALETVKFARPPGPIAPLAQTEPRRTPASTPALEEQFFEPTGQAARKTPVVLAAVAGSMARGTPSGGFSIQRPPDQAHIRISQGVAAIPPSRPRFVRASVGAAALAGIALLAWMQFGPARAPAAQQTVFPDVGRDARAIDVPVVAPTDSAKLRATDSLIAASLDSAAAMPTQLTPAVTEPNARLSGVRPGADSARVTSAPPPSATRTVPRQDSVTRGDVGTVPPAIIPPPPVVPTIPFQRDGGIISAGRGHSCALNDGRASCWGSNDQGQLGDGTSDMHATPGLVAGDFTFSQISVGWNHSCGLKEGNEVVCWGANGSGQLGDGTTQPRTAPVRINSAVSFRLVRAGRDHSCGLSNSRVVHCWGSNADGQLGDGTRQQRNSPTMVNLPSPVADLAVGWNHTCALTIDGAAWCWGKNDAGQLGEGSTLARTTPVQVKFDGQFVNLTAGASHSCGVALSGEAWCWGKNNAGQLGTGSTTDASTPQAVGSSTSFSTISAGAAFTCARGKDSTAWCWGQNNWGQLGDGSTGNRSVPVRVSGLSRVVSLNIGGAHACATTALDQSFCWGNNVDGQIGRGDRESASSPVRVLVPPR